MSKKTDKLNDAVYALTRMKGMFRACSFLMGGDFQTLEGEHEGFDLWFSEIQIRITEVIDNIEAAIELDAKEG